jgi:hypothetical protein
MQSVGRFFARGCKLVREFLDRTSFAPRQLLLSKLRGERTRASAAPHLACYLARRSTARYVRLDPSPLTRTGWRNGAFILRRTMPPKCETARSGVKETKWPVAFALTSVRCLRRSQPRSRCHILRIARILSSRVRQPRCATGPKIAGLRWHQTRTASDRR